MTDPTIIVQPVNPIVTISSSYVANPASSTVLGAILLAGDLSGTAAAPTLAKIQGTVIQAPAGGTTNFLRADGAWAAPPGGVQLAGDLAGTPSSPQVVGTHLAAPLPVAQGGTSGTTQQAAINALTGAQTAGRYLRSDGTNASLSVIQAGDVPVLNQNTTGTAANVTGVVSIANGGSGQGSQQAAINALTGTQAAGRYLRSDGTNATLSVILAADLPVATTSAFGAVEFESVVGNLQPVGTALLGANSRVADSGHIHPYPAWTFSVQAQGAKGDGKIDNTGSMTSGSAVLTTTNAVFSAGDVGKIVMVKNAVTAQGVAGQSTLVTTISTFTSSTSVTLAANAANAVTNAQVMWATDDTVAIQAAIAAASTYAKVHGYAEVFFPSPVGYYYGVGGPLKTTDGTNAVFNSQLTVPINAEQNTHVTLVFRGVGDGGFTRYWNSNFPAFNGTAIVSFGVFTSAANQSASITNGGNPSVIGTGTGKNGYGVGTPTPLYNNIGVVLQDLSILTTHSNSGWTYSAGNFFGAARFHAKNLSYGTTGVVELYNGNSGDYNNVTLLSAGLSIGLLLPANGNNASNSLIDVYCNGGYTYGLVSMEHTTGKGVTILYCWSGICPCGNYADSGVNAVSALHASWFDQLCVEACTYHVNVFGAGASAIGPIFHAVMDTEGTLQLRDNPNNGTGLNAALGEVRFAGSPSAITTTFATGLRLIKEQNLPGVVASPPTITINTAVMNTYWRPVTVYFGAGGGTGITTVQVSQLAGGSSAPTLSTAADFTASGVIPAGFSQRLGPGQWIKVSGTTLQASGIVWVAD